MTTPSILAYVQGSTVNTFDNSGILPDFAHNQIYGFAPGSDAVHSGMLQFTGYPSGALTIERSLENLGIGTTLEPEEGARALTPNGYIVCNINTSNSCNIVAIVARTLTASNLFGIASATTTPSTSSRILTPRAIVPIGFGLYNYVALTSLAFNKGEICIMSIPAMVNVNIGRCTEDNTTMLGPGRVGSSSGTAYALSQPTVSTNPYGLYEIGVPLNTLTRLGSITPADIDPTWVHVNNFAGLTYDETDGNVLAMFQTNDSVANQVYIVKLSTFNAAVLWAAPITNFDAFAADNMSRSVVKNGTFFYLDGNQTLRSINTTTGAVTTINVSILEAPAGQVSEDISGSIIVNSDWIESSTHPTYLGVYMGPPGNNHTLSGNWARFWPGAIGPIPPVPPPPGGAPVVSAYKAWTYVLDGHTFYVLDLGAQGTFCYDFVTQQWTNFTTGTPAAVGQPNPEWNFINGWQWQDRIVGGDITTADLWEMVPSAMLDNDVTEISHVSTGGISTRTRQFHSCDSVRVTASFGILDNVSGTTFNLRFSDDYERTWSPYFSITLTEGAYDSELAWRSLGSFAAPGRIFEISDTGGLVRIDGCDAMIDGFDNDPEDQNQNKG